MTLVWFKDYFFWLFGIIRSLSGTEVRLWLNLFERALVNYFFGSHILWAYVFLDPSHSTPCGPL